MNENEKCWYCNITPYGDTISIGKQIFNDESISSLKLNQYNAKLLTGETRNMPNQGTKNYSVIAKINYCPMCGRKL